MKPGKCISISLFKIIIRIFIEQNCLLHKQWRSLHFVWWRKCFKHDKKAGSFYLTLLILKFKIIGKSLISNSQSLQHLSEYQIFLLSQNLFVDPVKLCSLKALLLQWHISCCCFVRIFLSEYQTFYFAEQEESSGSLRLAGFKHHQMDNLIYEHLL